MKTNGLLNAKQIAHQFGMTTESWLHRVRGKRAPQPVGKLGKTRLWQGDAVIKYFELHPPQPQKAKNAAVALAARKAKLAAQQSFKLEPVAQTITAPAPTKELGVLEMISAAEARVLKDCTSREMRMARARLEEAGLWASKHFDNVARKP